VRRNCLPRRCYGKPRQQNTPRTATITIASCKHDDYWARCGRWRRGAERIHRPLTRDSLQGKENHGAQRRGMPSTFDLFDSIRSPPADDVCMLCFPDPTYSTAQDWVDTSQRTGAADKLPRTGNLRHVCSGNKRSSLADKLERQREPAPELSASCITWQPKTTPRMPGLCHVKLKRALRGHTFTLASLHSFPGRDSL
jgi:hypothetical protein